MPGSLQGQLHCCCRFQGRAPQERRPCDDDGKLSKGVCSSALHASSQPRPVASLARPRRPASIQHVPLVSSWLHGVGSRPDRLAHARATHMTCIPAGLLRWLPVCQRGCTWNAPGPAAGRSRSVCVCTCKTRPALALLFGAPRGRLGAARNRRIANSLNSRIANSLNSRIANSLNSRIANSRN